MRDAHRAEYMPDQGKTLTLIDGSSYVHRAYRALPPMSTSRGVPTHAVLGFTNMLRRALREVHPTHIAVAFDPRGPTFRHTLDPSYKANRPATPDDLIPQFGWVRKIVAAMAQGSSHHVDRAR